jgi:hypothetical protein
MWGANVAMAGVTVRAGVLVASGVGGSSSDASPTVAVSEAESEVPSDSPLSAVDALGASSVVGVPHVAADVVSDAGEPKAREATGVTSRMDPR